MRLPFLVSFAVLTLAYPAAAQTAATAAPRDGEACVLHVFPTEAVHVSETPGSGMSGVLPALMDDAFKVKHPDLVLSLLRKAVPVDEQVRLLQGIDFANSKLGAGRKVTIHAQPWTGDNLAIAGKRYRTSPRLAEDSSPCYAELAVGAFYYENRRGHTVQSVLYYREFGTTAAPLVAKVASKGSGLNDFPPDDEAETERSIGQIRAGYRYNIVRFVD